MSENTKGKLLLIDGNSIMNRGYYALPKELVNSKGAHTNALLGFLNIFFKVYEEEQPSHIAVAFDVHQPTFRHLQFAEYKGTRKGMDDELREQFPVIKDILHTMGITTIEKGGYEADDILGTLSRRADEQGFKVTVMSGDRDLLQLATDKVHIRIPKTKAGKTIVEDYYADDVKAEYGVTPIEFIEMKGLMGDTSDNIPGVPGIGPKTAEKLISKYHTVEAAIEDLPNMKQDKAAKNLSEFRDQAIMSRDLATIKLDCELDTDVDDLGVTYNSILSGKVLIKLKELELNSIIKRLNFDASDLDMDSFEPMEASYDPEKVDFTEYTSFADIRNEALKSDAGFVALYPVWINGYIDGCAFCVGSKAGFIRNISADELISFINEGVSPKKLAMHSLKEFIVPLKLTRDCGIFDISLAAYLIDPLAQNYDYTYLADRYLDFEAQTEKELLGKTELTIFSYDDPAFRKYLLLKCYSEAMAAPLLEKKLEDLSEIKLYDEIEFPLQFVLRDMEIEGIGIDKNALVSYGNELKERLNELTEKIYAAAGEEFNINSPKQLGVILFEKLGLEAGKKNKTGYSTSIEVLEKLKNDHEIVGMILEYRGVSKLISTYVEGLLGCIAKDGRIHSTFNQTVTATGRISSTEPNLQNIPTRTEMGRGLRRAFVPREGYVYVDADYSQIELRVMAAMSGDASLIEAFKQNKDIHAITASQVFGVPLEDVDSSLRRKAKAVNFGIIYGISSFGLGQDLDISRKEASDYIEKYFATYGRVKSFLDEMVSVAKKTGSVKTMFNRIRPIPELSSSNFMQRSFGERVAMNSPIQGTAADIIKKAMIDVYDEIKKRGLKSRLILQIHDELLIEAEESEVDEIRSILEDKMTNAVVLSVPLLIDMHTAGTLYDAK